MDNYNKLHSDIKHMVICSEYENLVNVIHKIGSDKFSHIINEIRDNNGWSTNIFHQACCSSPFVNIIKLLVENGADYNMKTGAGNTGLHLIVDSGFAINRIKYLLTLDDIDIYSTNNGGFNPVIRAKKYFPNAFKLFDEYITKNVKTVLDPYLCDDLIGIIVNFANK